MATRQHIAKPPMTVSGEMALPLFRTLTNTLPAIAARAPTEMSCPPEAAVTSVMPIERMTSSDAPFRMAIRFP